MHRTDPSGRARRNRALATISRLLTLCDILCLQETRLGANDKISLKTQYNDKYIIYYENDILGHGGALTMVSRKFTRDHGVEGRGFVKERGKMRKIHVVSLSDTQDRGT